MTRKDMMISQAKQSPAKPRQAKPSQALGDLRFFAPFFAVRSIRLLLQLQSRYLHGTRTLCSCEDNGLFACKGRARRIPKYEPCLQEGETCFIG